MPGWQKNLCWAVVSDDGQKTWQFLALWLYLFFGILAAVLAWNSFLIAPLVGIRKGFACWLNCSCCCCLRCCVDEKD